jgi:hypothetical protein
VRNNVKFQVCFQLTETRKRSEHHVNSLQEVVLQCLGYLLARSVSICQQDA